ncbi:MAG: DUF3822 family protein [Cyclobacteriaceae bacterium]|nr:DUF3822 family protein [Cyclobacteriaceae bacterium]
MENVANTFKLVKRVKDEKFSIDKLHNYTLIIQIGIRDLQVSVIDSQDNRCLTLEDYVFAPVKSVQEHFDYIKSVFDSHHFLMAGFWKSVKISVKNQKFSHVPASFFIPESSQDFLSINCRFDPKTEKVLYYKSIKSEVITVFALDLNLYEWINSLYPNSSIGFVHQSSALIEGILDYSKSHKNITMYLYIDRFKLHILTIKGNGLEYYNQFSIKQFSEYIKYIMLVVKGLQHDQNKSNLVLWGYIGKQSPHYNEFYKYIKNISFGDRPDFLRYGYVFDEIQDHHFFDLYNIYLCD